jgi:hypothetical protein
MFRLRLGGKLGLRRNIYDSRNNPTRLKSKNRPTALMAMCNRPSMMH